MPEHVCPLCFFDDSITESKTQEANINMRTRSQGSAQKRLHVNTRALANAAGTALLGLRSGGAQKQPVSNVLEQGSVPTASTESPKMATAFHEVVSPSGV